MRRWEMRLFACATGILVGFQDPDDGLPPVGVPASRPKVVVPVQATGADAASVALAGLEKGERAEILTWERVYKLAIVRARSEPAKGARLATTLDLKKLDEDARRVGFDDFARFRRDSLGGPADGPRAFATRRRRCSNASDGLGRRRTRKGECGRTSGNMARRWS